MNTQNHFGLSAVARPLLLGLLLAGCGGSNTYSPNVSGGTPGFTLSVAPGSRTATQGQSATYTVTAKSTNGFSSAVGLTITGLPAGATGTFAPASLTPTSQGTSSTLTVATSAGSGNLDGTVRSLGTPTPVGTYTFTVTGTGGGITRTATGELIVQAAPAPSFTITILDQPHTIVAGQLTSYEFDVKSVNGFAGTVTFSAANLPPSTTATFFPTTVNLTANGTAGGAIAFQTSTSTPAGTYSPAVIGTSGTLTNQATQTLIISGGF